MFFEFVLILSQAGVFCNRYLPPRDKKEDFSCISDVSGRTSLPHPPRGTGGQTSVGVRGSAKRQRSLPRRGGGTKKTAALSRRKRGDL